MSSDFYKQFILPYAGIIIKMCRAYSNTQEDFEDYYQEVCLQIWRSHEKFQHKSEWSTWIYKVSLNVCLTLLKKDKKIKLNHSEQEIPTELLEDSKVFDDEDLNLLYLAIKRLSEVDRAVILLYLEEKSYEEISNITGTTSNNIGVRINRIKERLKKLLDGKIN